MPQSLARISIHLIFSTKDREPFLRDSSLRSEMHRILAGILKKSNCPPLLVNGVDNHVHLLFALGREQRLSDLVKELKRQSSVWLKTKYPEREAFTWQSGYAAFSVSHSQEPVVQKYIANQEEHHRQTTFQEEIREFLQRHDVDFDERYVWD
jgi:REP element-mobilizing transposase RayT